MNAGERSTFGIPALCAFAAMLAMGVAIFARIAAPRSPEVELAGFSTSVRARTAGQRHNARLAALALNGQVIAPGAVFSFNDAVQSWTSDRGYVKAPVSFDGELTQAYGGGVCQTSTTLYNAALLAGLPIVERHPHVFAPHYIPPGRDAAVAFPGIDLRFRNPYRWPLELRAALRGDRLGVRIMGSERPSESVNIVSEVLDRTEPAHLTRVAGHGARPGAHLRSRGEAGCHVVTYRTMWRQGREVSRERLGDDTYPVLDHVVTLVQ